MFRDNTKNSLEKRVENLAVAMEKMKIAEYVEYLNNTRKMLMVNLLAGIARGFGMAIGFTILSAVVLYMLQRLVLLNLPLIGDFIANLMKLVEYSMNKSP